MDPWTQLLNRSKIMIKSCFVAVLGLLLLIPSNMIQGLVTERQARQKDAVAEINSKWADAQTVTGPVIGVPYTRTVTENNNTRIERQWAYFLPGKLDIHARIVPVKRYRGIFQVTAYTTEIQIKGAYDSLAIADLGIPADQLSLNDAAVFINVSDVQGLREDMVLHIGGADLNMVPGNFSNEQFQNALSAALPASVIAGAHGAFSFSATLSLKGSRSLLFTPVGKETKVEAASTWADPSFTGSFLPDLREVKDSGFVADWRVLYLNRNFPQQWKGGPRDLEKSAFGVNLIQLVDSYQQTTRSVKYAILVILLTFTTFFLIEWIYQRPIHFLQYALAGVALCIFYTLLLSFSEYIGFNQAYLVAAVATIGLLTWYVRSVLRSGKMAFFIAFLLTILYGFIFTLIQLQDYALLMGSIGLFVTLAVVMYFSRKIKWDQN